MSLWLRGVMMTDDEVETAIIATCLRPECKTEAYVLYWLVTRGTTPDGVLHFGDEQALWKILHAMREAKPTSAQTAAVWITHVRYEHWWVGHQDYRRDRLQEQGKAQNQGGSERRRRSPR